MAAKIGTVLAIFAFSVFETSSLNALEIMLPAQPAKQYEPELLRGTVDSYSHAVFAEYAETIRSKKPGEVRKTRFRVIRGFENQELPDEIAEEIIIDGHNDAWVGKTSLVLINLEKPQLFSGAGLEGDAIVRGFILPQLRNEEMVPNGVELLDKLPDIDNRAFSVEGHHIIPMTKDCLEYIEGMPTSKVPPQRQLVYALKFIDSEDLQIANDAMELIRRTPLKTLLTVSGHVPREKMLEWLEDEEWTAEQRHFAILFLGMAGNSADYQLVEQHMKRLIQEQDASLKQGLIGLLLLDASRGLELIEAELFSQKVDSGFQTYAFSAIGFFRKSFPTLLPVEETTTLIRNALKNEATALQAIASLTEFVDGDFLDEVNNIFHKKDSPIWVSDPVRGNIDNVAVARYLLACSESSKAENEEDGESNSAKNYLDAIRENDPQLVAQVEAERNQQQNGVVFPGHRVIIWDDNINVNFNGAVDFVIEDVNFELPKVIEVDELIIQAEPAME